MKQLIIILLVCTCTNRIFCQSITNNNYDNKGIQEFASHILNYKDDFLVLSGSKAKKFEGSYGILIRRISKKGEVIWTDFYKDESDSIYYYFAGQDNSILVNDSLLFAFGSAQDVNLDLSLTFFKYNLYTRQVVGLKIYNSTYGGRFYTAHLHNDGYFYAGGIVYKNKVLTEYDMLLMKIDINGEVIWEKEYAYGEQEDIFDIESYNDLLICTGRTVDPVISTQVFISKIDTNGEIKQFETFFEFGDVGATGIEVQDDAIYMTSNSEIELVDEETTYLSKLDGDFNVVWDTLIASSSKYDLQSRSMSLINNQIIILGNINPSYHHTNWKKWTYATSWSLDGKLNWEQLFYYDVDFIHYLDDVAGLPNGDLVFMGTTSGFLQEGVFSKNLWLFRTDNMGCGTVQDKCYYTLDDYFSIDTMVSIIEVEENINTLEILGNPFGDELQIKTNLSPKANRQLFVYNTLGTLMHKTAFNVNVTIKTKSWLSDLYIVQLLENGKLLGLEKVMKQ